jgi:signal transduction histidine kinase
MLGTHVDITERKRVEEARRHAHKLESLGVLAGGIAHDFNNLLTAIMGNLNLAQMRVGEHAPASPYLDKMERTVLKAAELSRQMLAYSGKGHFVIKPRNLNTIIHEMAGLLAATLPKKLRLDLDLAPALPMFKADGAQIQQVVMNLITNAAEAVGNQEGTITLTTFHGHLDPELLAQGLAGFVQKPYRLQDLVRELGRVLATQGGH